MPRAAKAAKSTPAPNRSAANVGYEAQLWRWPTLCAAAWTRPGTSTWLSVSSQRWKAKTAGIEIIVVGGDQRAYIRALRKVIGCRCEPADWTEKIYKPDIAQQVGQPLQEARIPPLQ